MHASLTLNIFEQLLSGRFVTALTRGGPGGLPRPIEVQAHDPRRYIGDMLAWVHQVEWGSCVWHVMNAVQVGWRVGLNTCWAGHCPDCSARFCLEASSPTSYQSTHPFFAHDRVSTSDMCRPWPQSASSSWLYLVSRGCQRLHQRAPLRAP